MKNYNFLNNLSNMAKKIIPYQWEKGIMAKSLRFDTNTMPYPPIKLNQFLNSLKDNCPINEYADPTYKKLKKLTAQYENVNPNLITITNSGDEAIDILAKSFLNPGDKFIVTPPTYDMFDIQCSINNGQAVEIPLTKDKFALNAEEIIKQSKNSTIKIIFLVNPNNPTGSIIPQSVILKIVKNVKTIVIVDEAYREFYGENMVSFVKNYENLVVLRSFSKFAGIAGARIGYLIANPLLSQKFDAIRFPMGVSYFSYKLAEFVLEKEKLWIKKQIAMIKNERKKLTYELNRIGLYVYPSYANFLLVKVGVNANKLYLGLKQKGIIVRDRSKKKYLEGCIRITVRSSKENKQLIKTIKEVINEF